MTKIVFSFELFVKLYKLTIETRNYTNTVSFA